MLTVLPFWPRLADVLLRLIGGVGLVWALWMLWQGMQPGSWADRVTYVHTTLLGCIIIGTTLALGLMMAPVFERSQDLFDRGGPDGEFRIFFSLLTSIAFFLLRVTVVYAVFAAISTGVIVGRVYLIEYKMFTVGERIRDMSGFGFWDFVRFFIWDIPRMFVTSIAYAVSEYLSRGLIWVFNNITVITIYVTILLLPMHAIFAWMRHTKTGPMVFLVVLLYGFYFVMYVFGDSRPSLLDGFYIAHRFGKTEMLHLFMLLLYLIAISAAVMRSPMIFVLIVGCSLGGVLTITREVWACMPRNESCIGIDATGPAVFIVLGLIVAATLLLMFMRISDIRAVLLPAVAITSADPQSS